MKRIIFAQSPRGKLSISRAAMEIGSRNAARTRPSPYPVGDMLIRQALRVFTKHPGFAAVATGSLAVGAACGAMPEVRVGLAVTANYFDVLSVGAQLGRNHGSAPAAGNRHPRGARRGSLRDS